MSELYESYQSAKEDLFDSLRVLDTYIDGVHKPQVLMPREWVEVDTAPGVWIKSIALHHPAPFALALVHGFRGAKDYSNQVADNVELHLITGRLAVNDLEIKAGDRIWIPANVKYKFEYMEDTYLTAKFIPINDETTTNFSKHGCNLPLEDSKTPLITENNG